MITKKQALHRLNAIRMTMLTQNTKNEYSTMLENFNDLEQYINQTTPPTEEEVCKALSEWWGDDVRYKDKEFYCWLDSELLWIRRFLLKDFPPHLITMLGRFYESRLEE